MSESQVNQPTEGERIYQERCLCREAIDQLGEFLGVSPAVKEHLKSSRIEFLKAIRTVIDERIEHLSKAEARGTKVAVE